MASEMEWEIAPVSAFDGPFPKVEPEEDPLGGDTSPGDVTVPSPETVPPVPTPQAAPGIQIVDLNNLLQKPMKTENRKTKLKPQQSQPEAPGSLNTSQPPKALAPATGQPRTTKLAKHEVKEKSSDQPADSTPQNVPDSAMDSKIWKFDSVENELTDEPEQKPLTNGTSIEDELSELLKLNKPLSKSSATQPISLHSGHLGAVPSAISTQAIQSAILQPNVQKNSNSTVSQTTNVVPSPAQSVSSLNPVSKPNVVLLLTTDGRLVASQITQTASSAQNSGGSSSKTKTHQLDPTGSHQIGSTPRKTISGKSSSINTLNSTEDVRLTRAKPKVGIHLGKVIGAKAPLVPPPVTSCSALWPPPGWLKKKPKPKIDLPLSGSWTNPNPPPVSSQEVVRDKIELNQYTADLTEPETDPLAGPVQAIIPYPSQPANSKKDLTIGTFVRVDPSDSNQREALSIPRTSSKATQCHLGIKDHPSSSRDMILKYDPPELKKPPLKPIMRGVGITTQSKSILYNVLKYFEKRKAYYKLPYVATEVAESATGVRVSTLRKLLREAKNCCNSNDPHSVPNFTGPTRRRKRVKTVTSNMHLDTTLRRYIHEYLLKKKESPGLKFLKNKCHAEGWKAGNMVMNFIRLQIKTLGFVSVRTARRLIHIEGAPIRAWRYKYLKQMETAVENKKNVVFTFVVNLRDTKQSATEWEILDSFDEIQETSRVLTIFHAANENGFIDGAFFINDADVDSRSTNEAIFQEKCYFEWLELHVLKKLPEGSVIVLAHRKYHQMADSKMKPNAGSSKKEVVDWLRSHLVGDVDETLPKCVLLEEVGKFPEKQKYTIDDLVETYGHTPVHLPPSQRDLNPIEYIWEDFRAKAFVNGRLKTVKGALAIAFDSAEPRLKDTWQQVRKCEETYRKNDPLLEDAQEAAVRKLGGLWNPPSNGPLPDETGEALDLNLSSNSGSSDSDLSGQSDKSKGKSASDSDSSSNSGLDSDSSEDDDSDESDSSESSSSDSENSQEEVPTKHVNGNKRRKIE